MSLEAFAPDAQPEAYNAVVELTCAFPACGSLALLGKSGTGKTHLAVGALLVLADAGIYGRYAHLPALVLSLNTSYDRSEAERQKLEPLLSVPLLVLDDVGREKLTDHMASWLDRIADARWVHRLPTILAANLSRPEVLTWLGRAAASRMGESCQWVTMAAVDRRLMPARAIGSRPPSTVEPCGTCDDAGWLINERWALGTNRLMRCPTCQGRTAA